MCCVIDQQHYYLRTIFLFACVNTLIRRLAPESCQAYPSLELAPMYFNRLSYFLSHRFVRPLGVHLAKTLPSVEAVFITVCWRTSRLTMSCTCQHYYDPNSVSSKGSPDNVLRSIGLGALHLSYLGLHISLSVVLTISGASQKVQLVSRGF